jgi:DNA-binding PadR family transcriptional regulator
MNIPPDVDGADAAPRSLEDIRKALHDLETLGLVRRTGEIRRGRPVFALTALGRAMNPNGPLSEH